MKNYIPVGTGDNVKSFHIGTILEDIVVEIANADDPCWKEPLGQTNGIGVVFLSWQAEWSKRVAQLLSFF